MSGLGEQRHIPITSSQTQLIQHGHSPTLLLRHRPADSRQSEVEQECQTRSPMRDDNCYCVSPPQQRLVATASYEEPAGGSSGRPTRRHSQLVWTPETIDNEHMNKKKSKCCCIYEKPREFDESSSSSSSDGAASPDRFNSDNEGRQGHRRKIKKQTVTVGSGGGGCSSAHCRGHKSTCYRKVIVTNSGVNDGCAEGEKPPDVTKKMGD